MINIEYQIVVKDDFMKLEEAVKELIGDGWVPIGGVAINETLSTNHKGYEVRDFTAAQAMLLQKCDHTY